MTIEERFDKLTERHEAFTINLELMSRDFKERANRMDAQIDALAGLAQKDGQNIRALAGIAQDHKERIERLEA